MSRFLRSDSDLPKPTLRLSGNSNYSTLVENFAYSRPTTYSPYAPGYCYLALVPPNKWKKTALKLGMFPTVQQVTQLVGHSLEVRADPNYNRSNRLHLSTNNFRVQTTAFGLIHISFTRERLPHVLDQLRDLDSESLVGITEEDLLICALRLLPTFFFPWLNCLLKYDLGLSATTFSDMRAQFFLFLCGSFLLLCTFVHSDWLPFHLTYLLIRWWLFDSALIAEPLNVHAPWFVDLNHVYWFYFKFSALALLLRPFSSWYSRIFGFFFVQIVSCQPHSQIVWCAAYNRGLPFLFLCLWLMLHR